MDANWNREVELIDVAGADQLVNGPDALRELIFGDAKRRRNLDFGGQMIDWEFGAERGETGRIAVEEKTRAMVKTVCSVVDAEPG